MYPSKDMPKSIHSNTVHNRQNLNTEQMLSCSGTSRCVSVRWGGMKPLECAIEVLPSEMCFLGSVSAKDSCLEMTPLILGWVLEPPAQRGGTPKGHARVWAHYRDRWRLRFSPASTSAPPRSFTPSSPLPSPSLLFSSLHGWVPAAWQPWSRLL